MVKVRIAISQPHGVSDAPPTSADNVIGGFLVTDLSGISMAQQRLDSPTDEGATDYEQDQQLDLITGPKCRT